MSPLEIICIVILGIGLGAWLTRFLPYSDEPDGHPESDNGTNNSNGRLV